ncbi:MAG: GTP 3',8-cyclase MoaA [Actinomycetota bacterium]
MEEGLNRSSWDDGWMARTQRPPLIDRYGRTASDLRLSVTDRCNFRCRYCMPPEGLDWLPRDQILSFEELIRLAAVAVESGIRSIKVTGGEPLVRKHLHVLIRGLRALGDDLDISLTTNGFLLTEHAEALAEAGLDRVTVSCDSLVRHRFEEMTLRDGLERVMSGLDAAAAFGLTPVKINTVIMRDVNEDQILPFTELARRTGYEVRFIEYMPLDAQDEWSADAVVGATQILETIAAVYPLLSMDGTRSPATSFRFADGAPGAVGVIPSVSQPFCDSCDRVRITADGQMRSCLFSLDETDLRGPLRQGKDDDELAALMRDCVAAKWAGHRIGQPDFVKPSRSMSSIGG